VKSRHDHASLFAYVADGRTVARAALTSPENHAYICGFSPRTSAAVIATFNNEREAMAVGEASRSRTGQTDESGNRIAVFGGVERAFHL